MEIVSELIPEEVEKEKNPFRFGPVWVVLTWELRRLAAHKSTWLLLAVSFLAALYLMWSMRLVYNFNNLDNIHLIYVTGTSALGTIMHQSINLIPWLGIAIPFLATNMVAREYQRNTAELLLSSQTPRFALVMGRYLAGLFFCMGLAVGMLLGTLVMAYGLFLDLPLDQHHLLASYLNQKYPAPNTGAILQVWAALVVPSVLLVYNLSFGLGTLLPRATNLVKALIVFGWVLGLFYWVYTAEGDKTWAKIHPQYLMWAWETQGAYRAEYRLIVANTVTTGPESRLLISRQVEQKLYDVWSWQGWHLLYITLSLGLVLLVATRFRPSRQLL